MWIYLLRHGIAEDPRIDQSDEERALTEEGQERLQRCTVAWKKLVRRVDLVVCSPLVRARQTADVFVEAISFEGEVRLDPSVVPSCNPIDAMAMLEGELLSNVDGVAIIGHEPHLGYLLGSLLTGHNNISLPLKKGMLVAVETDSTTALIGGLRYSLTQKAAARLR